MLDHLTALKRRARARARGGWRALTIFGLLTLASIVLYRSWFDWGWVLSGNVTGSSVFAGLPGQERSPLLSLAFWVVTATLGYLACALVYRRHAARHGVSLRWRSWVWTGLALFALMLATLMVPLWPLGWRTAIAIRQSGLLTPLLPIGLGLLVLAVVERSVTIGLSAGLYTFLVVAMGHFRLGQLPLPFVGLTSWDQMTVIGPNLILLASVLFVGAALDAAASARARRRAVPGGRS